MTVQKTLTDLQLLKMEAAVEKLSKNTHNAQAITLAHNLRMSKDIEEKRKWIVLFYTSCFQLISFMNMGRDNQFPTVEDFKSELDKLMPHDLTATVPNGKK